MSEIKNKNNRYTSILVLVAILALPGFLYTMLETKGTNSYKPLHVFGEKTLTGTFTRKMGKEIPDTLFHQVDSFRLVNQEGEVVEFPFGDTTITIVNFFYSRCETFCQHLLEEMDRVADRVITQPSIRLLSISVDSLYDTPEHLKEFSSKYHPTSKKWDFLTNAQGVNTDVMQLANQSFLLNAVQDPENAEKFVHSSSIVLLDSRRRIRGVYDVNHPKEVNRLIDEIKVQLLEEVRLKSPY